MTVKPRALTITATFKSLLQGAFGGGQMELGSMAVEMVVLTPVLVLFLGVVMLLGRLTLAKAYVDDAARASAEAAVVAPSATQAISSGRIAALNSLSQKDLSCQQLNVVVDTTHFQPSGYVVATIRCAVELAQLSYGLPVPGWVNIESKIEDPIEEYRSIY